MNAQTKYSIVVWNTTVRKLARPRRGLKKLSDRGGGAVAGSLS
jgi:hypothetical protein